MERIFAALLKGLASLMHPRMLWLMVWPMLVALVIWATMAALYWSQAATWIDLRLHQWPAYEWAISVWPLTLLAAWLGWLFLLFLFVPVVLITAVLIISIVSMPAMVAHVGERDYPGLARRKGGTFAGSLWNAVAAIARRPETPPNLVISLLPPGRLHLPPDVILYDYKIILYDQRFFKKRLAEPAAAKWPDR